MVLSIYSISFLFCGVALTVHAQSDLQTTNYRNMVIDLGNGLKTNARLNLPANGEGPFPAVLLVPGSGLVDMNETLGHVRIDNETGSKIYPPARPFFQIAEYLSERGFAVLQYDKRGVGANSTILDSNVWGNVTFDDLKQDAEKALDILIQQPEVDANKVALVGHSEGTMIAPRVSIDNPDKVDNIVLMGAIAQNLGISDLGYFQGVTTPLLYAQQVLDHNHNGLISVSEASENPVFSTMVGNLTLVLTQNITTVNGASEQLHPQYDMNNDTFISINDELKPRLIGVLKSLSVVTPDEKCLAGLCPIWLTSQYFSIPTLDIISNVPSDTSILIQQGKNDSQTPIQQAFLLQQELTEVRHPDHTLITYPDLGHVFYPSSQWLTATGPIEPKVLEDLFGWLSDPVRDFKKLTILSSQMP
ncbi:MAG: alpha/beta fold hydrolase [Thermoproteota archaeon]|nr:alpha/beta fold hydrolase [Thermoproteota archaeon]